MGLIKLKDSYPAEFPESIHPSWCPSPLEMEVYIVGVWWYGMKNRATADRQSTDCNGITLYLTASRRWAWKDIVSDSMVERYVVGVGWGVMGGSRRGGANKYSYSYHQISWSCMVMVTVIFVWWERAVMASLMSSGRWPCSSSRRMEGSQVTSSCHKSQQRWSGGST